MQLPMELQLRMKEHRAASTLMAFRPLPHQVHHRCRLAHPDDHFKEKLEKVSEILVQAAEWMR